MTIKAEPPPLVLASASPARRALLQAAGLAFDIIPAGVDERSIRDRLVRRGTDPADIALALAEAKAEEVSRQLDGAAVVIGADQILLFAGEIFEKPADKAAARETLERLRGKTHQLISAVVGYKSSRQIWSCCESARLTMREFSDVFLEAYLQQNDGQLASVGAYRIEGMGAQLFSRIDGDIFTILGLPLLPLLDFLRGEELLST